MCLVLFAAAKMVEENEDLLFKKNKQIMDSLNINTAVGMSAWDSYQKIKTKFTLEVLKTALKLLF